MMNHIFLVTSNYLDNLPRFTDHKYETDNNRVDDTDMESYKVRTVIEY